MVHHSIPANHHLIDEMKRNFPQYNFKPNGRVKDRLDRDIKKGLLAECAYSINNHNISEVDLAPKKFGDGGVDFTNLKYNINIDIKTFDIVSNNTITLPKAIKIARHNDQKYPADVFFIYSDMHRINDVFYFDVYGYILCDSIPEEYLHFSDRDNYHTSYMWLEDLYKVPLYNSIDEVAEELNKEIITAY